MFLYRNTEEISATNDCLMRQAPTASASQDRYPCGAGGRYAFSNRKSRTLNLPGDAALLDIDQITAAMLQHRQDEGAALVARVAK